MLHGERLRPVVVVLHVGDLALKGSVFADTTAFGWIGEDVPWPDHDVAIVLGIPEVLDHLLEIFHMRVGRISRLSNMLGRPECLLVADFDLSRPVLFAHESSGRLLEGVADSRVAWPHEEGRIALTFLHGSRSNVVWFDQHILHFIVWVESWLFLFELEVTDC